MRFAMFGRLSGGKGVTNTFHTDDMPRTTGKQQNNIQYAIIREWRNEYIAQRPSEQLLCDRDGSSATQHRCYAAKMGKISVPGGGTLVVMPNDA